MFTVEKSQANEAPQNTIHPLEKVASFSAHMQNMDKQKETDAIIEVMGQHFDLSEPYQPRQFSEEEMNQFFEHQRPDNMWLKSWQDPRQAFGFLQYAENNVRDYIFALHPDLIYEDDEGKPHMKPTIDIDGKVYVAKHQPQTENGNSNTRPTAEAGNDSLDAPQKSNLLYFDDMNQRPDAAA